MPTCDACHKTSDDVYTTDDYVLCYECVKVGRLSELKPFSTLEKVLKTDVPSRMEFP